jgi:hypothetical protein
MTHCKATQYGFEFGSAAIERACSDDKKGWVLILLKTPRDDIQLYVTKTGKVRVFGRGGEWRVSGRKK